MRVLQKLAWIAGLALLFVGGAALLPIDAELVRRHTAEKLLRANVKRLQGSSRRPADPPQPIRLTIDAPAPEQDALRDLLRRLPAWAPGDTGPEMTLTVRSDEGDGVGVLRLEGSLAGRTIAARARIGDWTALLPPLVALIIALALRRIVLALFVAVWAGACLNRGADPISGLWYTAADYLAPVLSDSFNLQILGFTFALVGMVAVVGRMGGTRGLVDVASRWVRGPRSAQVVTGLLGIAVFFDDYANTVVVGSTAKGLTDRQGVSREKLAYLVDSTSAPIAGIAVVSTWIGYEVGLFSDVLSEFRGIEGLPTSGYALFFEVLPLRFYCLFALALVFLQATLGRELPPMLAAERRARAGQPIPPDAPAGELEALEKAGVPPRWYNAVLPVGAVLGMILAWILAIGRPADFNPISLGDWVKVFDTASDDVGSILFWSGLIGSGVAFALAFSQRLLTPREALGAYGKGLRTLADAAAILILAWAIKMVCDDLGTGLALVGAMGESLPPVLLPVLIFMLAGAVAFCTGTSWGTMALVLPVAAPLSVAISGEPLVIIACLGAVLDGAIWGDHCSPISDTTVLSSTASGCPLIAHVRTQLPYALLAMAAAGLCGYVGYAAGWSPALCYVTGVAGMAAGLWLLGRPAIVSPRAATPS